MQKLVFRVMNIEYVALYSKDGEKYLFTFKLCYRISNCEKNKIRHFNFETPWMNRTYVFCSSCYVTTCSVMALHNFLSLGNVKKRNDLVLSLLICRYCNRKLESLSQVHFPVNAASVIVLILSKVVK